MGLIISLILIGILLLLIEILITPGVGLSGILGLLSLVMSCVYGFHEGNDIGFFVIIINISLVIGMITFALRSKTWKRFALNTVIESKNKNEEDKMSVGDKGITLTRLSPVGKARINGIICEVTSLEDMIDPHKDIVIVMIEDNKVYVEPSSDTF